MAPVMCRFRIEAVMSVHADMGERHSFKIVLLGEGCVGKTSLVLRYCQNIFNESHRTTLQVRSFPFPDTLS